MSQNKNWMIYGATGYTGQLIAREAVKRGHKPILAGRSEHKLKPLAEELGLEYTAFGISDMFTAVGGLQEAGNIELVMHCAGPFIHTSSPMLKACLQIGAHYLDLTGEIPVYENTFLFGEKAKERNIVLISGVGFDIVPSDCLNRYVAEQIPNAISLEVVVDVSTSLQGGEVGVSAGTFKSFINMIPGGGYVRRGGKLIPLDFGMESKMFDMPNGQRAAMAIPWGDLSTAYRSTGIPNITTYGCIPPQQIAGIRSSAYLAQNLLKIKPLREWLGQQIDTTLIGPSEQARETNKTYLYARATDQAGNYAEAWLETIEAYKFTAIASIMATERVLDGNYSGAMTPAEAFGSDFVLDIAGTQRFDILPSAEVPHKA